MLADELGWRRPDRVSRLNAADRPSESIELSSTDRQAILEQVEVDIELYDHAGRLFQARGGTREVA
jgi:hypothetical protein